MTGAVAISTTAYEVLWEQAGHGRMHPAVSITYPLRDRAEAARVSAQAGEELRRRGLLAAGHPVPELSTALRALAAPRLVFSAALSAPATGDRCMAVALDGAVAVFAELVGEELRLRRVDPNHPAEVLVASLPPARPGTGQSVSVPASVDEAARAAADDEPNSVMRPVLDNADLQRFRRITRTERRGTVGQLTVDGAGPGGTRRFAARPVTVLDLPDGRWSVSYRDSAGQEWITAAPATPDSLVAALHTCATRLR